MAVGVLDLPITVWNNNGEEVIWETKVVGTSFTVKSYGVSDNLDVEYLYGYSGTGTFLGLSTSPSTTTPTYGIGSTIDISTTGRVFYMVEIEGSPAWQGIHIRYKNSDLGIGCGATATFRCKDKIMIDNIVMEKDSN